MNLYKISQDVNYDYDTFDSAIVAAKNEEQARLIHPDGDKNWTGKQTRKYDGWCDAEYVKVELIGKAIKGTKSGVILASYNAG